MKISVRKLTETAVLLALLVTLQAVTKSFGQLVTGSCVNGVLAITALLVGMGGGLTVALMPRSIRGVRQTMPTMPIVRGPMAS